MRRAVLFDLDDTLSDRPVSVRRMSAVFVERFGALLDGVGAGDVHAAILAADDRGYAPRERMAEQLCATLPWTRPPDPAELVALWREWIGRLAEPMPGVHATLEALREAGFALGVVTNGPVAGQNQKIDTLGIRHLLDAVVTSEEHGCAKPDPRIFAAALARVRAEAEESWFVGDNPIADVQGAEEAGLRAIWFAGRAPWPAGGPPPRHRIEQLDEVLDLIR